MIEKKSADSEIVRVLSKNDRSIDGMFVYAILVRALNCISKLKARAKTVFGHLNINSFLFLCCYLFWKANTVY